VPTYEYACRDCGQHVEVVQSFRDDPLTTCGTCGGRLRKVYGAAGIIFKGSGYYVNDSRKPAAGEGSSGGAGETKKDGKDPSKKEPSKETATPSSGTAPATASSGGESAA